MRKVFRFVKGIVKGVRDVAPVYSTEAEEKTANNTGDQKEMIVEYIAQKLTSRGIMVSVIIYAVDQIFSLGLFS